MTKKFPLYYILGALMLLASCETTVPLDSSIDTEYTIYALAVAGQPVKAHISHKLSISMGVAFDHLDLDAFTKQSTDFYKKSLLIDDASVGLTVNGGLTYEMAYDTTLCCYTSSYTAQPGDELRIDVAPQVGCKAASTVTQVPTFAAEVSKVAYDVYFDQIATMADRKWEHNWRDYDAYGADSLMIISFDFQDPPGERNYYRLKVRSCNNFKATSHYQGGDSVSTACDVFFSSDPLFYDSRLVKGYGSWSPYFSNVFDDHSIDGKNYRLTVRSRKRLEPDTFTIIEMQSISESLFYYLKSIQLYRISTDDVYSNPIAIDGNVDDGWGVFGALNTRTYIIHR